MTEPAHDLLLGAVVDDEGVAGDAHLELSPDDLTTHGVIVGMTGSGKTGLGVVLLEELLRRGIPTLILDPKGDMGNLLLAFPELAEADFTAWVDAGEARREGLEVSELGRRTAARWRAGLADWGLGPDDIAALRARAAFTLFTPGSTAGVPLNVLGSLAPPELDWEDNEEALRDQIDGFVSGLLGLVDVAADPLTSREHILLCSLLERAWRAGETLDLGSLLRQIQRPPLRQLGVFDVDTFFPERDRLALAMRLNGLVASPSFSAWLQGPPLDVETLLRSEDGRPRAAVLYLAHLSEAERQFAVTLVLTKLIAWMRAQPGSSSLRALCYMDEVYGYAPPTAAPPTKKPILTLLKQARAFGVGLVLATQNPVDLDYKAMSNAGTWMVGRLQTERDKARILEALRSARGDVDVAALDRRIGALGKRQFLLHSARRAKPIAFVTRWAMSFLRGPLTRDEVRRLKSSAPTGSTGTATMSVAESAAGPMPASSPTAEAAERAEGAPLSNPALAPAPVTETALEMPPIAAGVPVYFLDPAARWARAVEARAEGRRLEAALVTRVRLLFDERVAGLEHREEWELVLWPLPANPEPRRAKVVDYDSRDFLAEPPPGCEFVVPEAALDRAATFRDFARELERFLHERRRLELFANRELPLFSRPGEARDEFEARCQAAADREADAELAKHRDRFEARLRRASERYEAALRRSGDAEAQAQAAQRDTWVSGAGSILDVFLGGRANARTIARRAGRVAKEQGRAGKAARRADTAQDRVAEAAAALEVLEADLAEAAAAIATRWSEKVAAVEVLEIGLEKDDIAVDEVAVVWVPK